MSSRHPARGCHTAFNNRKRYDGCLSHRSKQFLPPTGTDVGPSGLPCWRHQIAKQTEGTRPVCRLQYRLLANRTSPSPCACKGKGVTGDTLHVSISSPELSPLPTLLRGQQTMAQGPNPSASVNGFSLNTGKCTQHLSPAALSYSIHRAEGTRQPQRGPNSSNTYELEVIYGETWPTPAPTDGGAATEKLWVISG